MTKKEKIGRDRLPCSDIQRIATKNYSQKSSASLTPFTFLNFIQYNTWSIKIRIVGASTPGITTTGIYFFLTLTPVDSTYVCPSGHTDPSPDTIKAHVQSCHDAEDILHRKSVSDLPLSDTSWTAGIPPVSVHSLGSTRVFVLCSKMLGLTLNFSCLPSALSSYCGKSFSSRGQRQTRSWGRRRYCRNWKGGG